MSWKTVVGVICTITVILGTYIKFFDRPPAEETLSANRDFGGNIQRPSFMKHPQQVSGLEFSGNVTSAKEDKTLNSSVVNRDETEVSKNLTKPDSNSTRDESTAQMEDVDLKETPLQEGHGIKKFDWEGWVKDNNFVNIGSTWAFCDEAEPILVGKIILFDNGGSLTMTLVLNTTFEADITVGSVEVKVMYYDTVFYHKTVDLCEMAEKFEDDFFVCPIMKGEKYYYREQALSRFMPSGEFSIDLSLTDESEKVVLCGACKFKI